MIAIILIMATLAAQALPHLIISVSLSNSEVGAPSLIDLQILTNQTIPNNALVITFSTEFTTQQPCLLNGTNVTCMQASTSTSNTVTIGASLAANTYYDVSITIVNPPFASNFPITASASGVNFANTGITTINAKTIACFLSPSSLFVGDISAVTLTLANTVLPSGSKLVINSSLQSSFSNLFTASPVCSSPAGSLTCFLSNSFGQQFLTISNIPTTPNLVLTIDSMNNAPYNASLISASLQIQNQNSNYIQTCSLAQPAPTSLRTSTGLSVQNWNSSVGAVSSVTLTLNTYFTPFANNILLVYDSNFTITALTPTTSTLISSSGNMTQQFLSGGVAVSKSLSFLLQVTNPGTRQNVVWQIYVVYSNSLFVESIIENNLALTTLILAVGVSLTFPTTMKVSDYNTSIAVPYTITNGPIITISISYGQIQCGALNMVSNALLTVVNCSSTSISLNSSTLAVGTLWVSLSVINYFSVRTDNLLTASITGASPSFYSVGSGSASIGLTINNQAYTVTNSNTTFNAPTSFAIVEASQSLTAGAIRKFSLSLPSDLQLQSTTITSNNVATTVDNFTVSSSTSTILVYVQGPFIVNINGITNPIRYLGSAQWNFTVSDIIDNPSSFSQTIQSPAYTPTTATISIQLTSKVIEASSTMEVTVIPSLQYFFNTTITVTIPNSVIQTVCATCTALSSTAFSFPYSATIMKHNITVTNSLHPNNNSISLLIATSTIDFETASLAYTLDPMTMSYLSDQTGFFGQLGQVNITVLSGPTTPYSLAYSNLTTMLSSVSCSSCNNSEIIATGIVLFFQVESVILTGTVNGVVYATATATVSYICSSIQGCRICNSSSGSLLCQQCFTTAYTNYNLLYNSQCLQSCPFSTYSNSVTCVNCPTNCQICNLTGCLQCSINFFVYNLTCLSACPPPLVNNASHCIPVPIICPTNCANCPLNYVCTACDSAFLLLDNSCYTSCPSGYRPNIAGTHCDLWTPPSETSYFPFVFLISAALLSVALIAIKCYEKRSLVMGNLIGFLSVVEICSMMMTLAYTFQSSLDLLAQALVFVLILSKVLLNLVFLIYFMKIIVPEEDFQNWREQEDDHQRLYRALIVLSSVLSFQMIRILYSRLMGLRLFFGKFNTALIFKPLNFFTIAHFLTCGAALILLSVRNIIAQEGYKTSTFYSSLESIILEVLLLIACIVDNKKGYDDEFFEYQVYKVKNEYESSHIEPIEIEEQAENAGSMHEMLNAVGDCPRPVKGALIKKNPMWVKKIAEHPGDQDAQIQLELMEENERQKDQVGIIANVQQKNKKERLFRKKMVEEWRNIEKQLPKHIKEVKKNKLSANPKESANPKDSANAKNSANPNKSTHLQESKNERKCISPDQKRKVNRAMKRASSLVEFQVKLPVSTGSMADRIKQHFYKVVSIPFNREEPNDVPSESDKKERKKRRQRKLNKDRQKDFDQNESINEEIESESGERKIATMEVQRGSLSVDAESSDRNIFGQKEEGDEDGSTNKDNDGVSQYGPKKKQLGELMEQFEEQEQDNLDSQLSSNEEDGENFENRKNRQQSPLRHEFPEENLKAQFNNNPRQNKQIIVDYRYDGEGDQKERKYKTKKRRVNKQTEVVYLQRLAASSERKSRPKGRKIDF